MPLRNRKAERRIRTTPKGAYFPGFPYTLKSFGRWAFNRFIFNDKKKFVGITKKSIFATASLNLQIMTEFFDYFTKNYPQFVPISTTALVCFLSISFTLKQRDFQRNGLTLKTFTSQNLRNGLSNQMIDLCSLSKKWRNLERK